MLKKEINTKTKMVYLSSPNLVSGQSIPKEDVKELISFIPKNIII